ncbi:DUF934 domain-containing protein [Phyllobacterium sp. 0TCS1.6C]|uniref:DUF934 domain-containing protein n=1 Tax=unclassified Phyllobacterium TaxID=2638441 RepID=UPI002264DB0F|nr:MULTISPECIES: DUF934 domain-containing protein [unclassified Phyllobacterium]MCX8278753.1 DUF934 domain-containing protein [Phyllobacterium sp. 0TCS1.6C]MCX8293417.1 DUF934 domain-containing protein [Phyllobacterium sp. 0TCS1.6A]
MTETTEQAKEGLWGREGFREDPYVTAESLEDAGDAAAVILPLAAWLALPEDVRFDTNRKIGVSIAPGEKIDPLLPSLDRIPLIALQFPAFNDGRSYSKAELLKCQHNFKGELRAVGDVLIDQVAYMLRTGFDTLKVAHAVTLSRLAAHNLHDAPVYYQPGRGSHTVPGAYSWRRIPGA